MSDLIEFFSGGAAKRNTGMAKSCFKFPIFEYIETGGLYLRKYCREEITGVFEVIYKKTFY